MLEALYTLLQQSASITIGMPPSLRHCIVVTFLMLEALYTLLQQSASITIGMPPSLRHCIVVTFPMFEALYTLLQQSTSITIGRKRPTHLSILPHQTSNNLYVHLLSTLAHGAAALPMLETLHCYIATNCLHHH
jgi:hypothetical protein